MSPTWPLCRYVRVPIFFVVALSRALRQTLADKLSVYVEAERRALEARKKVLQLNERTARLEMSPEETLLLRQCVAVQSCAHGLLIDGSAEAIEAGESLLETLRTVLADGKKAMAAGRSPSTLNRETLDALLSFFDRWSGAHVQGWSGLAKVDEEAAELRTALTSKKK